MNNGVFGFNIAYYQLTADITVTTMAGTDSHKFKGHFDGNNHTLTLSYGTADAPIAENYCAPFRYIENAEIHDLTVAGTIYTSAKFAAGLASYALNDNTITNCLSSVTINSSVSGDGTHGGFVADCQNKVDYRTTVRFTGCAFNGQLLGSSTNNCGGFVGWEESNDWAAVKFTNCLFAPSVVNVDSDGSATFSRGRYNNLSEYIIIENSYYIQSFGTMQGEMAYITQPDNMTTEAKTIAGITVYVRNTPVTNVAATGITPNTATISWTGSEGCSNYQVRYRVRLNNTLYSTDFEGGMMPNDWTTFDNDGDGNNWEYSDGTKKGMSHSGDGCMYSASYINNVGSLRPDNWLVSPQLTLGGTMKVWLKGQDEDEFREHFAIYLSTTGDFLDAGGNLLSTVDTLVRETETTNQYQEYTADLSAYNGKGYIAIRHFNCQDEFYLVVDDFGLYDDNAGGAWTTLSNASPTGTTLTNLTADTTYEYQVRFDYGGRTYYTSTATLTTLNDNIAPFDLSATALSANTATLNWTGYGDSYNLRYSQGGMAKVTLYVPNDVWEDGTGYQMLLDEDHNTYGTVIPETGGLTSSGDASLETYALFEYKIPVNADGALNTSNVVNGTTVTKVTITIPAGTYDWCITNPSPGDRMWIASENGNVGGRQNDFVFEAGKHYTFTVTLDADGINDCVNMTVEDDDALAQGNVTNVTGITSLSYTLSGLTATTGYAVYVQSVKGEKTSEWSNVLFTTLGEGSLYVAGYGDTNGGWMFIASPVATEGGIAPSDVSNLFPIVNDEPDPTSHDYDLYRFNQSPAEINGEFKEWENYKAHNSDFKLVNGRGYLYARKYSETLVFTSPFNMEETKVVEIPYDASNPDANMRGWHLVGNPFPVEAYVNRAYYKMNAEGTTVEAVSDYQTTTIPPCTGILVRAESTETEPAVTFTKATQQGTANQGTLQMTVAQQATNRGGSSMQDNAVISFNEGISLQKFYFNESLSKLYIPQDNKAYAIVNAESQGEMPLNFEAKENGTYTISVNPEGVEMAYLHLIDNMTGADVDLLAGDCGSSPAMRLPAYTFQAKTTDYESRFKLVFSTKDASTGSASDEAFAFISNGNIIVNSEGVLQIIDVTGRVIVQGDAINRVSTSGMTPGVYVLRLINGNDVRTQKIVVR